MTDKEIMCSKTTMIPNSTSCMRFYLRSINKILSIFFISSPCSGTIISGYSKTLIDNSLKTHLGKALIPYKKFKIIHMVEPGLLKGNF